MKILLNFLTKLSILNFVGLIFICMFLLNQKAQPSKVNSIGEFKSTKTARLEVSLTPTSEKDLFAELKLHNKKNDCWIAYKGHIYDITTAFGKHPGGDAAMLKDCGTDATVGFDSKGKTPGVPHSANAVSLLQQYLVQ